MVDRGAAMKKISYWLQRWHQVLIITLVIRLSLFLFSAFLSPDGNLVNSWVRWDGPHYLDIAKNGYQVNGEPALFIVFYPLYPLLIKLVSFLTQDLAVAALLTSLIFTFIAAILLYELALLDFSRKVALTAVWFLNIFPTSYFLQASYTESLFLTTSLATVYFFRINQFTLAGISGTLASLTRFNGLLLAPTLIMEIKSGWKVLVTVFFTIVGFLIYLLINYVYFNDFFYFIQPLSQNWFKRLDWPWVGITNIIGNLSSVTHPDFYIFFSELVALIFLIIITPLVSRKIRLSYGIYLLTNLLLLTSTNFILSTPRYLLVLFPIYLALAIIKPRWILVTLSGTFLVLLILLTNLYIQGKWVF